MTTERRLAYNKGGDLHDVATIKKWGMGLNWSHMRGLFLIHLKRTGQLDELIYATYDLNHSTSA